MFSAHRLRADQDLPAALINRIIDAKELETDTIASAGTLSAIALLSDPISKYSMKQLGLGRVQRDETRIAMTRVDSVHSEDFKEAMRSLMDKWRPVFKVR
jgi:hypothetical protein